MVQLLMLCHESGIAGDWVFSLFVCLTEKLPAPRVVVKLTGITEADK
jgi:hypothetical protein